MRSTFPAIVLTLASITLAGEPAGTPSQPARGWWADAAPEGPGRITAQLLPGAFSHWITPDKDNQPVAPGVVTLYRWWTNTCPYCEASLPAVEALRKDFGPRGLAVVAVYHPKPPRAVSDAAIGKSAAAIGYAGPIAVDLDWSVLKKFWLSTGRRQATSVTFLVDAKGVIRYIHPGPDFFPSGKPEDAQQNADYAGLREAVVKLLNEADAAKASPATQASVKN
jgi:thiol-disulfide isomerase/thioredoxin